MPDCATLLFGSSGTGPDGASGGHDAVLYFRPRAGRDTEEFYADARYGELWVGTRASLDEVSALTGLAARHLDELPDALADVLHAR